MKDDLFKSFSNATTPRDTYAATGATSPSDRTFPFVVPRAIGLPSELPSLFSGEYQPAPSNLPEQVTQQQIGSQSRSLWGNVGPGDRSPLAGTTVEVGDND